LPAPLVAGATNRATEATVAATCAAAGVTTCCGSDEWNTASAGFSGAASCSVKTARWRNGSRFASKPGKEEDRGGEKRSEKQGEKRGSRLTGD